jgi:hypothetical protein
MPPLVFRRPVARLTSRPTSADDFDLRCVVAGTPFVQVSLDLLEVKRR